MIYDTFLNSLGRRSFNYASRRSFFESAVSHGASGSSRRCSVRCSGMGVE
jgi:hypothetical protein